ncbi:DNA-3-methyladenine glycosylase I [Conexibacter sp. CPCC 206217]|uniref:DNA-3-methyladenine glycosylase I n=1 Tax=Conexibacter sp. CPCC 206217 TaxID=3064574 RepID=UPI0027245A66|nr:DNA-3-methyladenine glycosylase I [Conexibacter sp. CPCC 206217]MDO8210855.1 DNA-3-methyladenine glycosylase I [Conexibacter sp. CPCC 206217]
MRCFGDGNELYEHYHDEEWGFPVVQERAVYERICLEAFQSGLAWITILRKRDNFRAAFAGFDPEQVAQFGDDDVARLMQDAGIVRNRAKIEATIANARAVLELRDAGTDVARLLWSFAPAAPAPAAESLSGLPATTPESRALAKALKRRGFRFVGPTTAYAAMQACGIVNDHVDGCDTRPLVARARAGALASMSATS